MKLIGLAGQKQNGKDTLADYLMTRMRFWERRAWADGLKKTVCEVFGVSLEFIEEWKENPEPPPGWNMTMRKCLQFVGDGMRQIKGNCWLEYTTRDRKNDTIITDGRYWNEFAKVKELGGINILVFRPGFLNHIDHPSESQLRPIVEFYTEMGWEGPVKVKTQEELQKTTMVQVGDIGECGLRGYHVPEGAVHIDYVIWNDGDVKQIHKKAEELMTEYIFWEHGNER